MEYHKLVTLKNGMECCLRNATEQDAQAVLDNFNLTHEETDFLLTYPEESQFSVETERIFLKAKMDSKNEIEIIAVVGGCVAGSAGIGAVGRHFKVRHRAEFGISVAKEFWGLGVGRALMDACLECARAAGFLQVELDVVAENTRAIRLYQKAGFVEFGRNPKGFRSRLSGFQEVVHMRLDLT